MPTISLTQINLGSPEWFSLPFDQQDIVLSHQSPDWERELDSDIASAIIKTHETIWFNVELDTEAKQMFIKTLTEISNWGSWGVPIERINALTREIDQLIEDLNNEFSKLPDFRRYRARIRQDYCKISKEGFVVNVICLNDIANPKVIPLNILEL